LNALIMPFKAEEGESAIFMIKKLRQEEYYNILSEALKNKIEIVSALGHEVTVEFLKNHSPDEDLKAVFKYNRSEVYLEPGDSALLMRVTERGKEIKKWTLEDMEEFLKAGKVEFFALSRVYNPEQLFAPENFLCKEKSEKEGE